MKKKILSMLVTFAMLLSMLPATALAAELAAPDMSGSIIYVTASNAQDVLDGAYGSINGKTIHFTESIPNVLDLARPTKHPGSGTQYVCENGDDHSGTPLTFTDAAEYIAHIGNGKWHTTPRYYRTLANVTFTADAGVTVEGFSFDAGHHHQNGYDYVRDINANYYKNSSLANITFRGLTIAGCFDAMLYMPGCTVQNITFDGCTFTGEGTTVGDKSAAIKFLADNQYFPQVTVKDCSIGGYYQGIYISGVDGAEIRNNTISRTGHNAVALQSVNDGNPARGSITVKENYISDVRDRAIRMNSVGQAQIAINNNIMVNCGDEDGQLIMAERVAAGAAIDLENNYWNGQNAADAVVNLDPYVPKVVGIIGGNWTQDVSGYLAEGYTIDGSGNIVADESKFTAKVGSQYFHDLQEAIKAAAPSGTVELLKDVVVDQWIMFSQRLSIGSGQLITLNMNGLTINGNHHTLTIKSIESAGNGNMLFHEADNLNINNLKIQYADGVLGGISLQSGELNNLTFEGGKYGVFPGTGDITIRNCTFKINGSAFYYETARENLTVTGNTFELPENSNIILLHGGERFTDNTILSGRTVNVVSGSPVVSGNTFAEGVRFKVYNGATAHISNNTITVLVFNDDSEVKSKFEGNILSPEAQVALDSMNVENTFSVTISIPDGAAIVVKDSDGNEIAAESAGTYQLPNGHYTYHVSKSGYYAESGNFTVNNAAVHLTIDLIPWSSGGSGATIHPITVQDSRNGAITVSPARASYGSTVTITVIPDTGYVLETLTVLDKNGKEIELTQKSDHMYTFRMPSLPVTVEASFMEDNTMLNYFVDVFATDYYYDAALWAAEKGITNGTSATTFSPAAPCTRAQMATFLWRAAGSPNPAGSTNPFVDVPSDAYYAKAVQWAYEEGITGGTSAAAFSPDAVCTRGQMAAFLWRDAGSSAVSGNVNPFVDVPADAYYASAVKWAYGAGITGGTSATTFSPNDPCTRAQMVTFLYRYLANGR